MRSLPLLLIFLTLFALSAKAQTAVTPLYPNAANASLAVTATTGASTATAISPAPQEMVTNTGSQTGFVAFGGSAVAATTTSIPIPAGAIEVFSLDPTMGYVSALTSTSTTQLYFTGGRGN